MQTSLRVLLLATLAMPLVAAGQSSPEPLPDPSAPTTTSPEIIGLGNESLFDGTELAPPAIEEALGTPSPEPEKEGAKPPSEPTETP